MILKPKAAQMCCYIYDTMLLWVKGIRRSHLADFCYQSTRIITMHLLMNIMGKYQVNHPKCGNFEDVVASSHIPPLSAS